MMKLVISGGLLGLLEVINGIVYEMVGPNGMFWTALIISFLVYLIVSVVIQIGTWALFFRRMRDVGFKTPHW